MNNKDLVLYSVIAVMGYAMLKTGSRVASGWTWNGNQWVAPQSPLQSYSYADAVAAEPIFYASGS